MVHLVVTKGLVQGLEAEESRRLDLTQTPVENHQLMLV